MSNRFSYIPHTEEDRQKMMDFLHIENTEELFSDIPEALRLNRPLNLQEAMSEITLERHMRSLANQNVDFGQVISFLGAGSYEHYQPSAVDAILSRSEFYTSYTPYQPEISQGMLQAIFEYQTMVAELAGMELANASMYDGPTAMAEAGIVCCSHTRRNKLLVGRNVHPEYRAVLQTYCKGQSIEVVEIAYADGCINLDALSNAVDDKTAGILIQFPNFFGQLENVERIAEIAHASGALVVVAAYPMSLGLLKSPGEQNADIVVAEGQSLGNSMSYGGPYLGIMAAKKELMRKLPGRIVGQTVDHDGNRGFVLTLQAREQHIRREKASSNICSNQALNALAATVFLSYMGKEGMRELGLQNFHKAHYLFEKLKEIKGVAPVFSKPFFNEFVLQFECQIDSIQDKLLSKGFIFGLNLEPFYPELCNTVLLNVTEMRTKEELDNLVESLREVLQ